MARGLAPTGRRPFELRFDKVAFESDDFLMTGWTAIITGAVPLILPSQLASRTAIMIQIPDWRHGR